MKSTRKRNQFRKKSRKVKKMENRRTRFNKNRQFRKKYYGGIPTTYDGETEVGEREGEREEATAVGVAAEAEGEDVHDAVFKENTPESLKLYIDSFVSKNLILGKQFNRNIIILNAQIGDLISVMENINRNVEPIKENVISTIGTLKETLSDCINIKFPPDEADNNRKKKAIMYIICSICKNICIKKTQNTDQENIIKEIDELKIADLKLNIVESIFRHVNMDELVNQAKVEAVTAVKAEVGGTAARVGEGGGREGL